MKVIFLDIDGVLCDNDGTLFPRAAGFVEALARSNGAGIVISSDWRLGKTAEDVHVDLFSLGIGVFPYGVTPVHTEGGKRTRWNEIQEYLDMNPEIESYVIIDDVGSFILPEDRTVQTNPMLGFAKNDVGRAQQILNERIVKV